MNTKKTSSPPDDASDLQAAAALVLERDEARRRKARIRAKRRRRERSQQERAATERLYRSVEVIKWCILAICSVWIISFIISIFVLVRVQSKVAEIEGQVQRIRHVMDNPLATAGARLGGQFDDKLKEYLGLPEPENAEQ